jgi:NAD(P)-dependent dehydrogenase (short-subunit alcohol dehydrogenase family)
MQLKDKVALITGTGSGIGRATALLFAQLGAKVAAVDRTVDQHAAQTIGEKFGRIDIVFANAGINGVWAPLEELEPEEWDRTIETNLKGTFLTVKYALPYLKRGGGSVIINASVNGTRIFSNTGATAYACSKAAQVAFTKMVALELAKYHIRVNVICPGAVETAIDDSMQQRDLEPIKEPAIFPEGRIPLTDGKSGTAEQVAQLVLFLASDVSSHITGTEIWIDGAESLLQG